jgi:antitoxin ParD1/3/4
MKVELTAELEEIIAEDLKRGGYRSVDEFLDRAVRILHEGEELLSLDRTNIAEEIALGLAQLDRGEGIPSGLARASLQERKARFIQTLDPR